MKSFLSNLAWIATSALIALIVIEGACRVVYTRKLDYQIEMSRYAATLKRVSDVYDIGHEHRPSRQARLMGVDVRTNSHGFRDAEYPLEKPVDTLRVMLLGDSLTFGWGVEAEDVFATRLQEKWNALGAAAPGAPRVEVLNTGVGNYNTEQQVAFYEARGRSFDPDLVLLHYFINDAEPTPRQRSPFLLKYSYFGMALWGRWDLFKRLYVTREDFSDYYPALYGEDREGWQRTRAAFARLAADTRRDGVALAMFLLPELHAIGPEYGFQPIYDRVREAALEAGIPLVVDLSPSFASEQPESLWVSLDDAHPNARAHDIIARGIHERLARHTVFEGFNGTGGN